MKASLVLEVIGDDMNKVMKSLGEKQPKPCWCAEITGTHPRYKYERVFLKGKKDYTHANSVGSRGVMVHYILETGKVYEVQHFVAWTNTQRYFCRVTEEGDIERISEDEATQCISDPSA